MYHILLKKLLDFLKNEPDDPFLKYALATEYLSKNETEKALFYFEDLLSKHPDYVGTYYHAGKLYERLDRKSEAILIYQKGMEISRIAGDNHSYSELKTVFNSASGLDYEDD
jgi:tetratricopeptide (TPR) repeat protein